MARLLLILLVVLATLSSDQAERLGLVGLRMPAFVLVTGGLISLALACCPVPEEADAGIAMLLALLVGAIALLDLRGTVDPIDYKLLLPVAVLFAAGPIAALLRHLDLPTWHWWVLSSYVSVTALNVMTSNLDELARGAGGIVRIDASGSLVTHTAFCSMQLVLSVVTFQEASAPGRLMRLLAGGCALVMLIAAATRTPFLTLILAGCLLLGVAPDRSWWWRRMVAGSVVAVVFLTVYSATIDVSLWRRLWSDGQTEWSTGRAVAIDHWLTSALDHPLGLGLGAVREALGDGKPALDGEAILDWPHNEMIRLWVEAGPFGLAFLLVLLGTITARALRLCRDHPDKAIRGLAVVVAADAITQSMFQNWLNSVYHATFGVLVVCVLWRSSTNRQTAASSGLTPQPTAV
ncbi:MAG TPA: O-antigen ligase family protein [Geminicoccus sp.]|uniref:O-antigen ligase family protein n=1 Tax=Geminicoccus sp. TaxID=2024832 RepID=UPI002E36E395|nr:O-antigen ligase family protein [Geminicoccus sp.]HEX2525792.1 O-antigen ligase family protein [Geminicoccus sp.]